MPRKKYGDETVEELLNRLAEGQSLHKICQDEAMPGRQTVYDWSNRDDELARRIHEAREIGYFALAEKAVAEAETCTDPIAGRLTFDARRWYLGKLSHAFRDKPLAIGAVVSVGSDDAYAAVIGALDQAAAAISGSGHSTRPVVIEGETRSGDTAGNVAALAGPGGKRLGEDADGS